jgi:hypothetical protein
LFLSSKRAQVYQNWSEDAKIVDVYVLDLRDGSFGDPALEVSALAL